MIAPFLPVMTLVVRPRPFAVATILYASDEADAVRALLEAIAPDQSLAFLLFEDDTSSDEQRHTLQVRATGACRLRSEILTANGVLEPNAVYFVPWRRVKALLDGELHLSDENDAPTRFGSEPFFASLAGDQGHRGCVIVFAGARREPEADYPGLSLVAEAGGLVMVQDAADGPFRRMIRTEEQTDPGAALVAAADLVGMLLEQAEPLIAELRPRETSALYRDVEAILPALCETLLEATGHDFGHYKSSTLIRRTLRRLHLIRCSSAELYLERLRTDRAEATRLFNDLLISVTAFFRDADAFSALASLVVPRLVEARASEEPVRIWVAGCATGEEAYSLAILLREHAGDQAARPPVQIFATDIDEQALSVARRGRYAASRLAHVSPERIARFFTRSGGSFQVTKAIRDAVLFTRHSLTNDPPFSNLDLVSCRNLLIYLGDELHHRVIPLFHYALRPEGFLFLGPSESLATHQDFFRPVDIKHRIFQRVGTGKRATPLVTARAGTPSYARRGTSGSAVEAETLRAMQQTLADEFTPRGVVVTDDGQVVAASGNLQEFMTVTAGPFVNSITRLVRDGLRVTMRSALREAVALQRRVVHDSASLRTEGGVQRVTITVQPLARTADTNGLYLVVFEPTGRPISPQTSPTPQHAEAANALIERLELDLATTRDELQRTVQDLEAVNEELKSSNEELLSMNEELQSANEELESSKEELQAANEELEDANSDLANLLTSTGIPTIFLDDDANVRRVTPAVSRIYNLVVEDAGRPLEHFTHKAVRMPPLPSAATVHAAERPLVDEVEMSDGTWYQRRVLPYVAAGGAHEGIVLTFTDLTERRQYLNAIRDSEARFRQLAETIPQLTWMARPDGHIFWYNRRWYDYTGTTLEAMEGWGWTRVHDPEVLPSVLERWRASVAAGTPFDMVFPLLGADGVFRPFLTRIRPFRDDSGVVVLWFGTNTDVSEERAQSEVLRRRERELQTLTDNSPDILARFDRKFRHVFVNAAIERVTGRAPQEFIGRTNRELGMSPTLCERWERTIERVFATGDEQTVEFEFETPHGPRYYVGRVVAELGADGNVEFALGVTRDHTVERRAADALLDVNRRKDEFLATLAHELRNPLAPVRNGLEILRLSAEGDTRTAAVRDLMERQVVNMTRLIDDLLDISRISLGKVELKREAVTVASVVDGALEVSRPIIQSARHELTVALPDEPLVLDADRTRLAQAVGNLLHNAAKYTPDGGHIKLVAARDGEDAVIRISDNGVGIPAAMLERVFDMFTQLQQPTARTQGGLGIGLALVRQLVEMHGGLVRAESEGPGMGSVFTLRLPLSKDPHASSATNREATLDEWSGDRLRVLVVDDNVDAATSLTTVLSMMGHDTRTVFSGVEALEQMAAFLPDVAFLDIGLPDISGYEVATLVRRDPAQQRLVLVALTGWGSDDHRRRSVEAGFDFHLTKPADTAIIRRILTRSPVR